MPTFKVYKGSPEGIKESTTTKPDLSGDQVLVKITASGLCGTDLHYKGADMVLGHEGIGVVKEIGPTVKRLHVGDRVGWGYEANSCGLCEQCLTGNEDYCPDRELYGSANPELGSFAEAVVWREAFLFRIPKCISDVDAAPLMCGGATVWNALHKYGLSSTSTVGIIGVGGLGHLAIEFASKMGMKTVVLSSNAGKKEEAMKLGASQFVVIQDRKETDTCGSKLDALLICSAVQTDWDIYLPMLKPRAIVFPLTVHFGDLRIPQLPFLVAGLRIQGTIIASRSEINQMLDFAAEKEIKPITQQFPLNKKGIEESIKTLSEGKMRYRGVLVAH
jgi:D-arabinose 1-dehydrogenase-like Zn-dependent alcohol dehydrogenase